MGDRVKRKLSNADRAFAREALNVQIAGKLVSAINQSRLPLAVLARRVGVSIARFRKMTLRPRNIEDAATILAACGQMFTCKIYEIKDGESETIAPPSRNDQDGK